MSDVDAKSDIAQPESDDWETVQTANIKEATQPIPNVNNPTADGNANMPSQNKIDKIRSHECFATFQKMLAGTLSLPNDVPGQTILRLLCAEFLTPSSDNPHAPAEQSNDLKVNQLNQANQTNQSKQSKDVKASLNDLAEAFLTLYETSFPRERTNQIVDWLRDMRREEYDRAVRDLESKHAAEIQDLQLQHAKAIKSMKKEMKSRATANQVFRLVEDRLIEDACPCSSRFLTIGTAPYRFYY